MHVPDGSPVEDERITVVVEGLKDLALDHDVPVLAVSAGDKEGISSGRRMRAAHLRGSSALAYEADTVLILNNKFDVVARHHLVYDLGSAERFRAWAVLTIEKNRSGVDRIDMEFRNRFDQQPVRPGRSAGHRAARRRAGLHRVRAPGRAREGQDGARRSRSVEADPSASEGLPDASRNPTGRSGVRGVVRRPRGCAVRLGSTWMPGPMVVESVTFLM